MRELSTKFHEAEKTNQFIFGDVWARLRLSPPSSRSRSTHRKSLPPFRSGRLPASETPAVGVPIFCGNPV
jgi:hypothetical protein